MYLCQASIEHFGCTDFGIFAQSVYLPKAAPQYAQYIFAARKFLPKATNSPHTPISQDLFVLRYCRTSFCLYIVGLFYKCRTKIARPQLHARAYSLSQLVKFTRQAYPVFPRALMLPPAMDGAACVRKPSPRFRTRALCPPAKAPSGNAAFFLYATTAPRNRIPHKILPFYARYEAVILDYS